MYELKWNYIDGLWAVKEDEILFNKDENRPKKEIKIKKIYSIRINPLFRNLIKGDFDEIFNANVIEASDKIIKVASGIKLLKIRIQFNRSRIEKSFNYFSSQENADKQSLVNTILEIEFNKLKN